jgi:hypothetical protein
VVVRQVKKAWLPVELSNDVGVAAQLAEHVGAQEWDAEVTSACPVEGKLEGGHLEVLGQALPVAVQRPPARSCDEHDAQVAARVALG